MTTRKGLSTKAVLVLTVLCTLTTVAGTLIPATPASATPPVFDTNIIQNPGADAGDAQDPTGAHPIPPIPGWTTTGNFTVFGYGTYQKPQYSDPGPADRGNYLFAGGFGAADSSGTQSIDVSSGATQIDGGGVTYDLSGWLGGSGDQNDRAKLSITFRDGSSNSLGTSSIGPVTAADRGNVTALLSREATGTVPAGTRSIDVLLEFTYASGSDNDGYADDLSLVLNSHAVRDNAGFTTTTLLRNDDGSTGSVALPFPINFFGTTYTSLYVNNNGNATFDAPLGIYTPFPLTNQSRVIAAPFFADVDTRVGGNPVTYGSGYVNGHQAFGVDWIGVNCYDANNHTILNSFQLVVVDRSDLGPGNFDMEFNYDTVKWETGTASGGNANCLGGTSARAGYSNGQTLGAERSFELPGSGVPGAFLDSNATTGLIHHDAGSNLLGRYAFQVRGGNVNNPPVITDVHITPSSPAPTDTLTANVTASDPDSDPLTTTYQWSQNGVDVPGANGSTLNLATLGTVNAGDSFTVRVTENDGRGGVTTQTASPVVVTAPPAVSPPNLNLALSVDHSQTTTGIGAVGLGGFPLTKIPDQTNPDPSAGEPLGHSSFSHSSFSHSSFSHSSFSHSSFSHSSFSHSSFSHSPLSSWPVDYPGGWVAILAQTANYTTATPQSVSLEQLLNDPYATDGNACTLPALRKSASDCPSTTAPVLTLGMINLDASPVANLSLFSFILGGVTWNDVTNTTPATSPNTVPGWCQEWFKINQPQCADSSDPRLSTPIFDSEANGFPVDKTTLGTKRVSDLSDPSKLMIWDMPFYAPSQDVAVNIDGSFLGAITIGEIPAGTLGNVVDCSGGYCTSHPDFTLSRAKSDARLVDGAMFSDLGSALNPHTLSELVQPFLDGWAVDWETTPLSQVRFQELPAGNPTNYVTYTESFDVACPDTSGLQASVHLPSSFRYNPGSSTVSEDGGSPATLTDPTPAEGGGLVWSLSAFNCTGHPSVSHHFDLRFKAMPSLTLGTYSSNANVSSTSQTASLNNAAPVSVSDAFGNIGTPSTAQPASADTMYVGHLAQANQTDFYKFDTTAGDTINISLSHLPKDYDLVLYGPTGSTGDPVLRASGDIRNVPLSSPPQTDPAANNATDVLPPQALQDVHLVSGLPVAGMSVFRGTDPEALTTTAVGGTYTVQVSGYNGAYSPDPYLLTIRDFGGSTLPSCQARTLPSAGAGTTPDALPAAGTIGPTVNTLFLVDEKRLGDTFGATAESDILSRVRAVATDTADGVNGVVIPIDASSTVNSALTAADGDPCSPANENNVVRSINDLVDSIRSANGNLPGLKNVVIVGDDSIIPHARIADPTTDGNERGFVGDTFFASASGEVHTNEIGGAVGNGYFLSDWPYGTLNPLSLAGVIDYLPQVAVGRLAGSAATIEADLDLFRSSHGVADPTTISPHTRTALETDYDFFVDGGQQIFTALQSQVGAANAQRLSPGTWTKSDFASGLFPSTGAPPDLIAPNAHYDQYRMLPPSGPNLFTTQDLTAAGTPDLRLRIVFTIGCHSGLDFPSLLGGSSPTSGDLARLNSWEQAYQAKGTAVYVGNLGYGYGDTATVAFSEQLLGNFARNIATSPTLGQAMVDAERGYFLGMGSFTPYDLKSMEEAVMWGLPMYRMPGVAPATFAAAQALPPVTTDPISGLQSTTVNVAPALNPETTSDGRHFFSAGSDRLVEAAHPYPIVPKVVRNLPPATGMTAHGALPTSLTQTTSAVTNYAFANATIDNGALEPAPAVSSEYPSTLQNLGTTIGLDGSPDQTLVVLPGQFKSSATGDPSNGTFRSFTNSNWQVFYSNSPDVTPPTLDSFTSTKVGTGTAFSAKVNDSSGIVRAVVQAFHADGTVQAVELLNGGGGTWSGGVPSEDVIESWLFVVDGAGNVLSSTNKAVGYVPTPPPPPPTGGVSLTVTGSKTNGWYTGVPSVDVSPSGYKVSIDGGTPQNGPATVSGDGVHRADAISPAGSNDGSVLVPIDGSNPVITKTIGAPSYTSGGTTYVSGDTPITVTVSDSGSGVHDCSISVTGPPNATPACGAGDNTFTLPSADGAYHVHVTANDNAGHSAALDFDLVRHTIVFTSSRTGNGDLYTMNTDGTGVTRLTTSSAIEANPAWSPDHSKIAFVGTVGGYPKIFVMNANGTGQVRLTPSAAKVSEVTPAWSPDGTKIAYSTDKDGNFEIYVANANGTGTPTRLTNNKATDTTPAWSPDGTKIAFSTDRDGNFEIYVANANGTGTPTRLTNNKAIDTTPSWFASKIVFSTNRTGNFEIFSMSASDGTGLVNLTNTPGIDATPVWSPGGTKIVFSSWRSGNGDIYVMNANGTNQQVLASNPAIDTLPAW